MVSLTYILFRLIFTTALALIIIAIIVAFVFLRTNPNKRKKVTVALSILLIIIYLLGDFLNIYPHSLIGKSIESVVFIKRNIFPEVPNQVKNKADDYIVSIIGQQIFNTNVEFKPGKSQKLGNKSYILIYEYSPFNNYGEFPIKFLVTNDVIEYYSIYVELPNCSKDLSLCEFNLGKKEFEKIKSDYNINGSIYIRPPYIYGYICPTNKVVKINYTTKEIEFTGAGIKGAMLGGCIQKLM